MSAPEAAKQGGLNPAAMTERLIDAAVYYETAQGAYVTGARRELNDARAAIETALAQRDELQAALAPFAEAARNFTFAIAPDGIDDGISLIVRPAVDVAYEAELSTADFSRAAAAIARATEGK